MWNKIITWVGTFVLFLTLAGLIALFEGWLVMVIWNRVVPVVFNYHTITYWQAFGLSWLCSLLFKSSNTSKKDN